MHINYNMLFFSFFLKQNIYKYQKYNSKIIYGHKTGKKINNNNNINNNKKGKNADTELQDT